MTPARAKALITEDSILELVSLGACIEHIKLMTWGEADIFCVVDIVSGRAYTIHSKKVDEGVQFEALPTKTNSLARWYE